MKSRNITMKCPFISLFIENNPSAGQIQLHQTGEVHRQSLFNKKWKWRWKQLKRVLQKNRNKLLAKISGRQKKIQIRVSFLQKVSLPVIGISAGNPTVPPWPQGPALGPSGGWGWKRGRRQSQQLLTADGSRCGWHGRWLQRPSAVDRGVPWYAAIPEK